LFEKAKRGRGKMKNNKKELSRFIAAVLAMLMVVCLIPVINTQAASDWSSDLNITDFVISNNGTTIESSANSTVTPAELGNGLTHVKDYTVTIYWELLLSAGQTIQDGDTFTFTMFSSRTFTAGWQNLAISNTALYDLSNNVIGSWSMTSAGVVTVTFNQNAAGQNGAGGYLNTGENIKAISRVSEDTIYEVVVGNKSQYYKYNKMERTVQSGPAITKGIDITGNRSLQWMLHVGPNLVYNYSAVAAGGIFPNTGALSATETDYFLVDTFDMSQDVLASGSSPNITSYTIQAVLEFPANKNIDTYEAPPISGAAIHGVNMKSSTYMAAVTQTTENSLDDFKASLKAAVSGAQIGSHGIFTDASGVQSLVVYWVTVPTTTLTYGDLVPNGYSSWGNYLQNLYGVSNDDKAWYDTVYSNTTPVFYFRVISNVDHHESVITGELPVTNIVTAEYRDTNNAVQNVPRTSTGYLKAADGTFKVPASAGALIKYDENGKALGGAKFKLQYYDSGNTSWTDYTMSGDVVTKTSLSNGQVMFSNLPVGTYRFVEIIAPTGYDADAVQYYQDENLTTVFTGEDHFTVTSLETEGHIIFAQNTLLKSTVTYKANGGAGADYSETEEYGKIYTVLALNDTGISRTGYTFTGWNTKANGNGTAYDANDTFTITGDVTLYAQWNPDPYVPIATCSNASIILEGTKNLTGKTLEDGMFSFKVIDKTNNQQVATGTNNSDGTISFDEISLNATGDYYYQVSEIDDGISGITYDSVNYDITVHVATSSDGTTLEAAVTYPVTGIEFNNTYTSPAAPDSVSITLMGTKVLKGKPLTDGMFKFVAKNSAGVTVATGTNAANGKITFDQITYHTAGTYFYTVSEAAGTLSGISYDTTEYRVEVKVADNGDGTMTATPTYVDGMIEFINECIGGVHLTKYNTAKSIKLSGAVFELYLVDGTSETLIGTYTTGSDGVIEVDNLAYGSYCFKEKTAPVGYTLNTAKISFTIDDTTTSNGTAFVNLEVTNAKKGPTGGGSTGGGSTGGGGTTTTPPTTETVPSETNATVPESSTTAPEITVNPPTTGPGPGAIVIDGKIVEPSPDYPNVYYVFDENGVPLGYVIVPDGMGIEDINIDESLIPFAALNASPKTGDQKEWCFILCLSGMLLFAPTILYIKRKKEM